jgi:hypothetical protein
MAGSSTAHPPVASPLSLQFTGYAECVTRKGVRSLQDMTIKARNKALAGLKDFIVRKYVAFRRRMRRATSPSWRPSHSFCVLPGAT